MRVRCGFVSNSSSSSFVINLADLTPEQIVQISNFLEEAELRHLPGWEHAEDWKVSKTDKHIGGGTWLNNFDMIDLFQAIGVPDSVVSWGDSCFDGESLFLD